MMELEEANWLREQMQPSIARMEREANLQSREGGKPSRLGS